MSQKTGEIQSEKLPRETKIPNKRGRKKIEKSAEIKSEGFPGIKMEPTEPKARGRKPRKGANVAAACKKEQLDEYGDVIDAKQLKLTDMLPVKKKRDRFHGMTEDEVLCRTLPDHLAPDLDILIIGINPGLTAAYVGHHYAGPGNHFWKCLFLSGLTPEQMNAYDDFKLKAFGIGFTNIVERTSRGSADLTKKEIKEGADILIEKIRKYRPKIAAFNGKGIYEVFCGHKNFFIGKQPEPIPDTDTMIFVMPSSSARFTQLPRAVDKVPFYVALKKLKDHLNGILPDLNETEVTFPDLELKVETKKERLEKAMKLEADADFKDMSISMSGQPNIKSEPVAGEVSKLAEGAVVAPKRRKRKSKNGEALATSQPIEPTATSSFSTPGLLAVKSEPGLTSDQSNFVFNGQFGNHFGNSNGYQLPQLNNTFPVKEEGLGVAPKSRKRKSKNGDAIVTSQPTEPTATSSFSTPGPFTVKSEPGLISDQSSFAFNGQFGNHLGNSSGYQLPSLNNTFPVKEEGTGVAPNRRKRKSKNGDVVPTSQPTELTATSSFSTPDTLTVKTEPGLTSDHSNFVFNGQFGNHLGYSNSYQLPSLNNTFPVKEEAPLDLSQYGVMPSSSDFSELNSSRNGLFQRVGNSNGSLTGNVPLVPTTGAGSNLASIHVNPYQFLASFNYNLRRNALARIEASSSQENAQLYQPQDLH